MGTTCVILQPSYIPWRGYFDQIRRADVFVFYDDVQYDRHGWRNRNRIKTANGPKWLTIPLKSIGERWREAMIRDMEISQEQAWAKKHLETQRQSYAKAPFFRDYLPMLERWYGGNPEKLADFTIETTKELAGELGIHDTRFARSSELGGTGSKTERLVQILKKVGATHYVSGPSAKEYLETEKLAAAAIGVEWMEYDYPDYPQLYPPFEGKVSILDLMFMQGPQAGQWIWGKYKEEMRRR